MKLQTIRTFIQTITYIQDKLCNGDYYYYYYYLKSNLINTQTKVLQKGTKMHKGQVNKQKDYYYYYYAGIVKIFTYCKVDCGCYQLISVPLGLYVCNLY